MENNQIQIQNDINNNVITIILNVQTETDRKETNIISFSNLAVIIERINMFRNDTWGVYNIPMKVILVDNVMYITAKLRNGFWAMVSDESEFNGLTFKHAPTFFCELINKIADCNIDYLVGKGTAEEFNKSNEVQRNKKD